MDYNRSIEEDLTDNNTSQKTYSELCTSEISKRQKEVNDVLKNFGMADVTIKGNYTGDKTFIDKNQHMEMNTMNSDDILKSYIDKIDKDQRDLKVEMREREERINKNMLLSEQRMDEKLERIERLISEQNNFTDRKFERMENKFDESVKEIKNSKLQIGIFLVTAGLSIVAIAFATVQVINGILSLV